MKYERHPSMKFHRQPSHGIQTSLKSGYAYKYNGNAWKHSSDERWEIVVISNPEGRYLGSREIDGSQCDVFKTPHGIFAQTQVHTRDR